VETAKKAGESDYVVPEYIHTPPTEGFSQNVKGTEVECSVSLPSS